MVVRVACLLFLSVCLAWLGSALAVLPIVSAFFASASSSKHGVLETYIEWTDDGCIIYGQRPNAVFWLNVF